MSKAPVMLCRRHSPCAHRGGHDDDDTRCEDRLERPHRGAAGLHHYGGDALLLQHQRRHPYRPDLLRAPQRLLWQLQEHHPHHVGAVRTLYPAVYIYINEINSRKPVGASGFYFVHHLAVVLYTGYVGRLRF